MRIDASTRTEGSHSRELADYFEKTWRQRHPAGRVIRRDLAATALPHFTQATAMAFMGAETLPAVAQEALAFSNTLIEELNEADDVLVSSPVYNFNAPSTLKAWADHVVREGRTFTMDETGFHGLLQGKSACLITARGGTDPLQADYLGPFLLTLFDFMGFERAEWIALEGTALGEAHLRPARARAQAEVDAWFDPLPPPDDGIEWRGAFSTHDKAQISALRRAQALAIETGDAAAYAALCADDITLMLQGQEMVSGREAFLACETALFKKARFAAIRQLPRRVERSGLLVVETGLSEVTLAGASVEAANYQTQRKYTHVLRQTADGWRFAVLMSSNNT